MTDVERFERHCAPEPNTGCTLWFGGSDVRGYGRFFLGGKVIVASRAAWELARGPIPTGLWVLHHCDNPPCVNPDHLFLGTHTDNMRDCVAKGRFVRPNGPPANRKLTEQSVRDIRVGRKRGLLCRELANSFGVSKSTIIAATTGPNWLKVERGA
ncbi:MAG TPA: HNH endonuclease [Polyangia bacterium]|nr:HNH endonuclease [Polyangia bacterium]